MASEASANLPDRSENVLHVQTVKGTPSGKTLEASKILPGGSSLHGINSAYFIYFSFIYVLILFP